MTDPDNREAHVDDTSDTDDLSWLEEEARSSPLGYIVIAYESCPEKGNPGWYLSIGDAVDCSRSDSLREAIYAARAESGR